MWRFFSYNDIDTVNADYVVPMCFSHNGNTLYLIEEFGKENGAAIKSMLNQKKTQLKFILIIALGQQIYTNGYNYLF